MCKTKLNLGLKVGEIDDKLSFDVHIINTCKTANNKLHTLSNINLYMKENLQKYYYRSA